MSGKYCSYFQCISFLLCHLKGNCSGKIILLVLDINYNITSRNNLTSLTALCKEIQATKNYILFRVGPADDLLCGNRNTRCLALLVICVYITPLCLGSAGLWFIQGLGEHH